MMPEGTAGTTKITDAQPNHIVVRGYAMDEMMGRVSFAEGIYLLFRGELPPPAFKPVLEAVFLASIDHGPGSPSASTARTVATTGAPLNASVAAGVLALNRFHGG